MKRVLAFGIAAAAAAACGSGHHAAGPAPAPAPAAPSGPVGTAGPMVIEASDPGGRWVVACQAREDTDGDGKIEVHLGMHGDMYGDKMRPFWIRGGGKGEAIDAFVDQSEDGDHVVVIAGGKLVAIAAATGARTELTRADLRDDQYPTLSPRTASFAGDDRIAFMRHRTGGDVVVARELAGGQEQEIPVPGVLWRVEADAGGSWARILTVRRDTDGNGKLEWPSQHTSLSDRGCRGPITSYSTHGAQGDEPDILWVSLDGGQIVEDDKVIGAAGARLVRVTADRGLMLGDEAVLRAGCDPSVRAIAADPPRVIAGCGATKDGKTDLVLVGPKLERKLGVTARRSDDVRRLGPGDRLACFEEMCIDVQTGAVRRGDLVYVDGDRVLVRRDGRYVVIAGDGVETALPAIDGEPRTAAGPIVVIGDRVVDLAAAKVLGRVEGEIAGVDRAGRALVTGTTQEEGPPMPAGPARWILPK